MKKVMNKKIFLLCLALMLLIIGCARTVTSVITYGNEISVEVTFDGNLDFSNNYYYMVISSQEAMQLPYDPYEPYEFIEPGMPPSDPSMDYYQYYQTWDGYVIMDNTGNGIIWLVEGPFTSSAESYADYTRTQIGEFAGGTEVWSFNFELSELYPTTLPTNIYFDLVSVSSSTDQLQDHLDATAYVTSYSNSSVSGSDGSDLEISSSLDISSYNVVIE